ncbi:MAG TPA: hypothetical protein VEY95_05195 [Azospirillaceae bacterium]|nr:hypothetical protein [Azospirillaceae bacterium]
MIINPNPPPLPPAPTQSQPTAVQQALVATVAAASQTTKVTRTQTKQAAAASGRVDPHGKAPNEDKTDARVSTEARAVEAKRRRGWNLDLNV